MNTFKDDVKSILSKAEPLHKTPTTGTNPSDNSIHITKYDYKNNNSVIVFAFAALCVAFVAALSFNKPPLPPRTDMFVRQQSKIDKHQADEIKILVKFVAACENKHINTIHNELKRNFGYYRYREIEVDTYAKVVNTLNKRLCVKNN